MPEMKPQLYKYRIEVPIAAVSEDDVENAYINPSLKNLISECDSIHFTLENKISYPVTVFLKNDYDSILRKYPIRLAIVFESEFSEQFINKNESFKDYPRYVPMSILFDMSQSVYHFLILSQIAYPKTIYCFDFGCYINDKLYPSEYGFENLQCNAYSGNSNGFYDWPAHQSLPMNVVLDWKAKVGISMASKSTNAIERALYAFSYNCTYNSVNTELALLWSMIGLEALYCEGDGKSKQIHDKAQVLFGEMNSFKDKLKKLYNFRSRLIHGEMDFPPNQYDAFRNTLDYHDELDKYATLACLLLTYTLQDIIRRGSTSMTFKYVLL